MTPQFDLADAVLNSWRITNRVTVYLLENLPDELWPMAIPGAPRRTVRMIAGHIHNARCMWLKMMGKSHGIVAPALVNRNSVTRTQLFSALERSNRSMIRLLKLGLDNGGRLPASPAWSPLPPKPDVVQFLAYFVAHEGYHRGQIVLLARQLGHRLPGEVRAGLWQWARRGKELRGLD
jgi:uncharacterized damage-inducible protein DinB